MLREDQACQVVWLDLIARPERSPITMVNVAILDDYQEVALSSADWSPVTSRADVTVFTDHIADEAALTERLATFDVIVAMRERTAFPATVLARLPRLRLLITTGMANASIDLKAAARLGITVCGTGGTGAATPELVWGLILALARYIPQEDAEVRAGGWQRTVGRELAGSTLGLLGLGRIGQRIARYARAFDMDCIAWSQNLTAERAEAAGARLVTKQQLFAEADIVSVHLKLSERTVGLVGAAELAWLGPDGLLVNTSRGPIVDEAALVEALGRGSIGGAALDVFDTEPLPPGHPLRTMPNTVLTPHIGYVARESYAVFYAEAVEDIAGWLDGRPARVLA
jgi:phosphoglycerate dehydrogenase-like enzyme